MDPLAQLGLALRAAGYSFITPTPETHRRVLARRGEAATLRDVFGWSRRFAAGALAPTFVELLERCGALERDGSSCRSGVRYSSLGALLCAHSAYPTVAADSVFFGPDTYRFAALLDARVDRAGHLADVGCGSGAGGLLLAPRCRSVQLLDINGTALRYARANAELNGVAARVAHSDILAGAEGPLDLVVANPPYLADEQGRVYRDGGGELGTGLSLRIAEEALGRLGSGGRLLLYTGTPVIDGEHVLWRQLEPVLRGTRYDYRELDPDVFGEELERPAYRHVERIAVVALDAVKS
ncbi:MAG TPA: class I SAM-dependent methyltransferase [Myxococcales bacterium]|nr:class I SAM-dependent methyltransferase [Myxococcales bacterium]